MEYDADDTNESGNWLDRIKQSPRTVSALIIILIVAAAIYAFSGNKQQTDNEQVANTSPTPAASESVQPAANPTSTQAAGNPAPTQVSQQDLQKAASSLPTEQKTASAYVETAQKGDGLTHLARRATTRYLSENSAGYTVTNEHRIFIEDYVRKHVPKGHVMIGSTHEISFDLLKDAVTKAGQLNDKQLHHLTKYTHVLKT